MVVKRGMNDDGILAMAERFRGTGVILRFIEYMDVGATNGWQLDEVVPSAEIVERDRRALAARARRARLPRRGRRPLPLPRRRRRDRPDLVGHPAVLPRLHARAAVGRGQALHLPVREPRPRPARAACAASSSDAELDERLRGLWRVRDDRYSELRTQGTPRRPAQGRDVAHRRLSRAGAARGAGARDEQLHADVLAARPLADVRRGRVRTLLERHGRGGVRALDCAGWRRRASGARGSPGPCH